MRRRLASDLNAAVFSGPKTVFAFFQPPERDQGKPAFGSLKACCPLRAPRKQVAGPRIVRRSCASNDGLRQHRHKHERCGLQNFSLHLQFSNLCLPVAVQRLEARVGMELMTLLQTNDRVDSKRFQTAKTTKTFEIPASHVQKGVVCWCGNDTREQAANVNHLAFLYPLVRLQATVPGSPQVVRRAIHGRAVVLITNEPNLLGIDSFVTKDCIEGEHDRFTIPLRHRSYRGLSCPEGIGGGSTQPV